MERPSTHTLPKLNALPGVLNVIELMHVTEQLRTILENETDTIKAMKVKELAILHQEKLRLTKLLEAHRAILKANPNLLNQLDEETREELAWQAAEFTRVVEENYRHVTVARAVNQRIVQTILDVVSEQHHAGTYTKLGYASAPKMAVSFNLNQKA